MLDTRLDCRAQDSQTSSDLGCDGQVVLRALRNYLMGEDYHITFPLIFLKNIMDPREHVPPKTPNNCGPLSWQEVEEFDGTWLFFRIKAFKDASLPVSRTIFCPWMLRARKCIVSLT